MRVIIIGDLINVEEYRQLVASEKDKKGKNKRKKRKTQLEKDKERLAGRKIISEGNLNEHITIGIAPVTKKNHQRIVYNKYTKQHWIMPSEQYLDYSENAKWFIPKNICINLPVNSKCLFYMPTRQKCDLSNLLESVDDVMVESGYLYDDNFKIIVSHDGSRVLYDKNNPRTEVYITNFKEVKE